MKNLSFKTKFLNSLRLVFKNKPMESFLFLMTNGKSWNQNIARLPANYYQYSKNSWREVERNGFKFRLDISDYMQWLIYFGIQAEPREKLHSLINPGMTIIDIGANIGETSLAFSKLTGEGGKVFSFEPDPQTFIRLTEHLGINECINVTAINKGLGKTTGELFLEEGQNNSGGNRISPNQINSGKKIEITTLDHFLTITNLEKIDFIKIDVEGYEYNVLLGAEASISKYRPVLFIECVDDFLRDQGASAEMLTSFLEKQKYTLLNAENESIIHSKNNFSNSHFDIIALPK